MMVEVEQEERKNDILGKLPDQIPVITAEERQQLDDQMRKVCGHYIDLSHSS